MAQGTSVDHRAAERHAAALRSPRGLVVVINGMLAGIGGVFMVTTSVLITAIAAVAALALALSMLWSPR